jgi:hypothetical protein
MLAVPDTIGRGTAVRVRPVPLMLLSVPPLTSTSPASGSPDKTASWVFTGRKGHTGSFGTALQSGHIRCDADAWPRGVD